MCPDYHQINWYKLEYQSPKLFFNIFKLLFITNNYKYVTDYSTILSDLSRLKICNVLKEVKL